MGGNVTTEETSTITEARKLPEQSHYRVTLMSLKDLKEFTYVVLVDTDNTLHMINRTRLAIEMDNPDRERDRFTLVSVFAVP